MAKRQKPRKKDDRTFHKNFLHYFEYTLWLVTGAAFIGGVVAFVRSDLSPVIIMEFCMLTAILVSEFID